MFGILPFSAGDHLLEAAARQSIYALSILLGQEPAALVPELAPVSAIPATPNIWPTPPRRRAS